MERDGREEEEGEERGWREEGGERRRMERRKVSFFIVVLILFLFVEKQESLSPTEAKETEGSHTLFSSFLLFSVFFFFLIPFIALLSQLNLGKSKDTTVLPGIGLSSLLLLSPLFR